MVSGAGRRLSFSLLAVLALVAALLVPGTATAGPAGPAAPDAAQPVTAPAVWPTPQHLTARHDGFPLPPKVGLVTGAGTDPSAVATVRKVLTDAGVRQIVTASDDDPTPDAPVVVWVGGPGENDASAAALESLGIAGPSGLAGEGYVLGVGRDSHDRARAVLAGVDRTGTFYAAQTLRQLVVPHGGRSWLPGVSVRDWPAAPLRGVIEGFYGPPWSTADRLAQLDFYAATKQNVYVYSPKDDPYLRDQWRAPYPPDQLAVIKQLVDRATADHVQFTYALSPGLSVCYSSDEDEQALVAKLQSMWDIGVRSFAIPLDDISYTNWNCDQDEAKFGTGGGAAGTAQAYLLNRVQQDFIDTHAGANRLEMVPTEYSNVSDSPYKTAIREQLDKKVIVEWTGVGVVPATITAAQAKQAEDVFDHDILIWDNYPVNDYTPNRLLLGPYTGREPGVLDHVVGVTANPMIEAEPSKIAEFTSGAYLWNPTGYDADTAWLAALHYLGGPAWQALKVFAENNHSSILDATESPTLTPLIAAFWKAYRSGTGVSHAAHALSAYFDTMAATPGRLSAMPDAAFVTEAKPWLDKLGLYGKAGHAAVDMLTAQRAGDGNAAWRDRLALESLRTQLAAISQEVAPGVMDPFLTQAVAASDSWLGVSGGSTATTSMGTYQTNVAAHMIDGDQSTFYWSDAAPGVGDSVGVDLGSSKPITSVDITMSKSSSPNDYIHHGVLEYSTDGSSWTAVTTVTDQPHVTATLPDGTSARYVRLRATATQTYWVVVDEFAVSVAGGPGATVSGAPPAASGSSLQAAADQSATTAYEAAGAPAQGDALQVAYAEARPLDAVTVLQDPAAPAKGDVQVRHADGTWHSIGTLSHGYSELRAGGATVDAVRVVWAAGTPAPHVYEIVPWYADAPPAALSVTPGVLDVEAGGDAAKATVRLGAVRAHDVHGTLSVDAPAGWQVSPGSTATTVYRGSDQSVDVDIKVPAGTAAKRYDLPVTFTAAGGTVRDTITVDVHPRTDSTNLATDGTAAASCVEGDGQYPQFDPRYAIDGDLTTRWSSCGDDGAWLQVKLPAQATLAQVVLHWETAYGKAYDIETSTDGTTWTKAASVTAGDGGTDAVYLDGAPDAQYVRMHGVERGTQYGYSLYELQVYPVAG